MTTVEPGYYKEGEFGVRTESLFVCKEVEVSVQLMVGGNKLIGEMESKTDKRRWLGWERLTQVRLPLSISRR